MDPRDVINKGMTISALKSHALKAAKAFGEGVSMGAKSAKNLMSNNSYVAGFKAGAKRALNRADKSRWIYPAAAIGTGAAVAGYNAVKAARQLKSSKRGKR